MDESFTEKINTANIVSEWINSRQWYGSQSFSRITLPFFDSFAAVVTQIRHSPHLQAYKTLSIENRSVFRKGQVSILSEQKNAYKQTSPPEHTLISSVVMVTVSVRVSNVMKLTHFESGMPRRWNTAGRMRLTKRGTLHVQNYIRKHIVYRIRRTSEQRCVHIDQLTSWN